MSKTFKFDAQLNFHCRCFHFSQTFV